MAADAWVVYPKAKENFATGALGDLNADTIKCILCESTSNAASAVGTLEAYATITNEVTAANGYATGGVTLSGSVSETGGTVTFDLTSDPQWTATGGSIVARFAVLYNDTPTTPVADPLIAYCLLDNTAGGTDVTQADGGTLTITIHSSGVFTLA